MPVLREFLDENGVFLNELGKRQLAEFLDRLPKIHEGKWGEAYVPLIKKLVMTCTDVAIVKDGQVLLKKRDDQFFDGWEFPGGGLGPGETWETAAQRFAESEFGMKVRFIRKMEVFNNPDNRRAHDTTILLLCESLSEPREGQWFKQLPDNIVLEHKKYVPVVEAFLAA